MAKDIRVVLVWIDIISRPSHAALNQFVIDICKTKILSQTHPHVHILDGGSGVHLIKQADFVEATAADNYGAGPTWARSESYAVLQQIVCCDEKRAIAQRERK